MFEKIIMEDRQLVKSLLQLGSDALAANPQSYAMPAEDKMLSSIGAATLANWLETLGGQRLIGDVQPCFTSSGASFQYRITELASEITGDKARLSAFLDDMFPPTPKYDLFISYASGDAGIAKELSSALQAEGVTCYLAERDIAVSTEWENSILDALCGSARVLVLLTPRSIDRPWVLMETGAAWALGKPLIPVLSHVDPDSLIEPLSKHQCRIIETMQQRRELIQEIKTT